MPSSPLHRVLTRPHRRNTLADVEVQALDKRRIDLPTVLGQDCIDGFQCAKYYPMAYPYQASTAHGFDDLRIEQPRQGQPPRLGRRALPLLALQLDPHAKM